VAERVEGLPLELLLSLACRMTGADRRMLVTAGEVLADMPATALLFREGALSWGQVRAVVAAVRRLPVEDRAQIDARIAASAERHDGIDAYDPDQLVWAVDQAVERLRDARATERAEARRRESSFVSVQAGLDGGVRLYAELDAVRGATVLNALDAAAARPASAAPEPGASTAAGNGHEEVTAAAAAWSSTPRARQYADALESVCADWLGGDAHRPARPLVVAHVDVSQLRSRADGTVELAVRGGLPRVSAATLEALAASGDVRAVVFDGARPPASVVIGVGTLVAATRLDASAALAFAERRGAVAATRARGKHHPITWSIASMAASTTRRTCSRCPGAITRWCTGTAGGCE
ncbi:MAG TPA: DUF222 domain-containing protein, partial [Egibacteraceae bacterium]|nr:DUF222 domain-containing protein [Egibacteraceae bacterium]